MSDLQLRIDGKEFVGWTSVSVTKSLEQLAHSFSVSFTDKWAASGSIRPLEIVAGASVSIVVDNVVLITGYVDADSASYDARSRSLSVTGRSKTGDLVDCSSVFGTGRWKNQDLLRIASDICTPFGISVSSNIDLSELSAFSRFSVEEGETAFATIERAARSRGVLQLTDSDGDLYFDRVSESRIRTVLRFGENVLAGNRTNNWASRFSTYTIKAQAAGGDNLFGKNAAQIKRSASDEAITRYRPLRLLAENENSAAALQKRVNWERNTRAGAGLRLAYTVQGWKHLDGFWAPNQLVKIDDPELRINDELLVASVNMSKSLGGGTITKLELAQPESFDVQPLPKPKRKKGALWQ